MAWIRIELSEEQTQELEQRFKASPDKRMRDRCQAILMAARGRKKVEIAKDLCVSRWSVTRWLKAYQESGIEGLEIIWVPGKKPLIEEKHAPMLIEWVKLGPLGCGLDRANWTFAELAHHFFQKQGIRVSERTMRDFCHRHDIRPYRPSYQYLRADPEKQAKAREELAALKKKLKPERLCC